MSGFMNPAEFANIAKSEEHFWWYRGMRTILFRILDPYLAGRSIGRVLEAGCGTGYLSYLLQTERGWPVVPMDYSWHGLRYARQMGLERAVQGDIMRLPFADGAFDQAVAEFDKVLAVTPNATGTPVSSPARRMPLAASLATYSKCGVSPRTIVPRATMQA